MSDQDISVVWDFTDLQTRFVTRDHSGLSHPTGWTVFLGAVPEQDEGSRLDARSGKLTIGQASFEVPDENEAVTAWVATNDQAPMFRTPVTRKHGLVGEPESGYSSSNWVLEDLRLSRRGGGFRFVLTNILSRIAEETDVYTRVDDTNDKLKLAADINDSVTTITLDEAPSGWPASGYAWIKDKGTGSHSEMVSYASIGGTGDKDLQGCVRGLAGAGGATSHKADDAEVSACWYKTGNELDILLEWLTTTDKGDDAAEQVADPRFDNWTDNQTLTNWVEGSSSIALLMRDEEQALSLDYCARLTRIAAGTYVLYHQMGAMDAGRWFRVNVYVNSSVAGRADAVRIRIRNETAGKYVASDGTTWNTSGSDDLIVEDSPDVWTHYWAWFKTDPAFADTDIYRILIRYAAGQVGDWITYDDASVFGPFTEQGNGPYDVGDGDGLGDVIPYTKIDLAKVEEVRDLYWPRGLYSATFIEISSPPSLYRYIVDHILVPMALWPTVEAQELFGVETRFRADPIVQSIGPRWVREEFNPGKWRRNWRSAINRVRWKTGYDPGDGEYSTEDSLTDADSIAAYGERPELVVENKGGAGLINLAAARIMLDAGNPWSPVTIVAFYEHKDIGIADGVSLDVPVIPDLLRGTRGVTGEIFQVLRRKIDDARGRVVFELKQRRTLYRPAFVAPNTVADHYEDATENDKQYCYALPEAESEFPDGTPPYKGVDIQQS